MVRSVLLALCIPSLSLGFVRDAISQRSETNGRQAQSPMQAEISSQDLEAVLADQLIPQKETELWLDLRRTAIHPKSAIEQLEEQIGASSFVDRILLSEQVFQNLVDFNDMYLTTSQILYQSSETDEIYLSSSQGLSTPFGSLRLAPSDAIMPVDDPMQAIEMISNGKWLLLGKEEENTEEQVESFRIDAVGKFLDIASTSCLVGMWDSSPETSGLVLPIKDSSSNEQKVYDESLDLGGVAVACDTKSALMQLASILQMKLCGSTNSVTESGIILQCSEITSSAVATAVVLPFAIDLWQVASLVFGIELYEEENDDFE
mmetsp:Transcript_25984/g.61119  ORF Transcript_25984/g.61119 Transcript_25984/m.61119 type:complete len:318 (-) Transcript_25984:44-997(-)